MLLRSISLKSLVTCSLICLIASVAGAATLYSDHVIHNTNPVIYWAQNETSGGTAFDSVGTANNGTYYNATPGGLGPRPSDGLLHMDTANLAPSVQDPSGGTRYLSLTSTAGVPTGSYSYQMWFNSTVPFNNRTLHYLFTRGNGTGGGDRRDSVYVYGNWSGVSPKPTGRIVHYNGSTAITGDTVLSPNTWNHLVFVRDDSAASKARIYLNGKLEIESTSAWLGGTGEHFAAATRTDLHGSLGVYGRYDEVALWDRPLSDSEARNLYLDALGQPYMAAVLRDQPEAYWQLNETTGTNTAADTTGNGHAFAYRTSPTRTGLPPDVGPRPAEFGGFESDNNAPTQTGDNTSNGFLGIASGVLGGQNDYSAEMWFRPGIDQNASPDYLLHRNDPGTGSNSGDYLGLWSSGTGTAYDHVFFYDGGSPSVHGTTTLTTGQWYHVGVARNGDDVTVYLNGQQEISTTLASTGTLTAGGWAFGGRSDMGQQKFTGNMDEIAIYGEVLGKNDFQENYLTAKVRRDSPYAKAVLNDAPEAYWRLDETAPYTLAVDAAGHGHTFEYGTSATRTGTGSDIGPRSPLHDGFEADNNAPTLTGDYSNGFLGIVDGVLADQNDYTVEMWVRPGIDSNVHGDYLLHRNDLGTGTQHGDFLGLTSPGTGSEYDHLFFYGGNGSPGVHGTTTLDTDQWYHVALVRDGDDVTVYLNGLEELSTTLASTGIWTDGTWAFGGRSDMSQQKFSGNIDEIAIYGRVLTEAEIFQHFQAAVPEPASLVLLALGVLGLLVSRRRKR